MDINVIEHGAGRARLSRLLQVFTVRRSAQLPLSDEAARAADRAATRADWVAVAADLRTVMPHGDSR